MAFSLRNRSFLKELRLHRAGVVVPARPGRRPEGGQVRRHRAPAPGGQEHRPDLREDLDPHAMRVRGRRLRPGRTRDLPRSRGLTDRAQGVDEGHRAGARPDVRRHPVPRLRPGAGRDPRRARRRAGVERPYRRMASHPDRCATCSRCASTLQADRTGSPSRICGDARNNVGNSLLVAGAMSGMDVRIVAPKALWNDEPTSSMRPLRFADATGAQRHPHRATSTRASRGVDFVYTDVWVSMGEPKEVWDERIALLRPYQVTMDMLRRRATRT